MQMKVPFNSGAALMLDYVGCTVQAHSVVCLTCSLQRIMAATPLKSRQGTLLSDPTTFGGVSCTA